MQLSLLFDTGCLVLIWMVQLIVYPSFKYHHGQDFTTWHEIYTKRITLIVLPLMVGQLLLCSYQAYFSWDFLTGLKLLLVLANWALTFIVFVPLHAKLSQDAATNTLKERLVSKNWFRTVLWSFVFVIAIVQLQLTL